MQGRTRPDRLDLSLLNEYHGAVVTPLEPDAFGAEAAFVMEDADRFYRLITSGDIRFAKEPKTVSVITFFVIRRAVGVFDIFIIHKIFEASGNMRRQVQSKLGITQRAIDQEVNAIRDVFFTALTKGSGIPINWNELDLSKVTDRDEQVRRIKAWNTGVKVKKP